MLLYTRVVVVGGQGEDPEGEDAQGEPPVLRVVPQGQLQPSTQPWSSPNIAMQPATCLPGDGSAPASPSPGC